MLGTLANLSTQSNLDTRDGTLASEEEDVMKSHPILEAIAVVISLGASACISVDDHDDMPTTTTVMKKTVTPQPMSNLSVTQTTETTTTRSR